MTTTVAAIIPTIPERAEQLTEAIRSVGHQTRQVDELLVETDADHAGPAVTRNRAVDRSHSEWLAFLDDDDRWHPHHIELLLDASEGADVVYSDCDLVGKHHHPIVNRDFDAFALEIHNYIPITALVRRATFLANGGFDPDAPLEDWDLWRRLSARGCTFVHVPIVTWEYRFHGDQRTFTR